MNTFKKFLKRVLRAKWASIPVLLGFLAAVSGWVWAWTKLWGSGQSLILHFNDYLGITRTGSLGDLNLMAGLLLAMFAINFLLVLELEDREPFWGRLLGFVSFFLGVLIFIGFVVIMNIN